MTHRTLTFKADGISPQKSDLKVNGIAIGCATRAQITLSPGEPATADLTLALLKGADLDIEQAVVRVNHIEIADVDESALRDLYERLKARFT